MSTITDIGALEALYGTPSEASLVKVADRITPEYRRLIEASPFMTLATSGPEGLDCSPRGERGGAVAVASEHEVHLPDRRGNNRMDSLRNIVRDPRVAALFLIPGSGTTIRMNGTARIETGAALLEHYAVEGKQPRSVVVITVSEIYTQCARAVVRADLWNPAHHVAPGDVPTPGDILREATAGRIDGAAYDRDWSGRAAKTLW